MGLIWPGSHFKNSNTFNIEYQLGFISDSMRKSSRKKKNLSDVRSSTRLHPRPIAVLPYICYLWVWLFTLSFPVSSDWTPTRHWFSAPAPASGHLEGDGILARDSVSSYPANHKVQKVLTPQGHSWICVQLFASMCLVRNGRWVNQLNLTEIFFCRRWYKIDVAINY